MAATSVLTARVPCNPILEELIANLLPAE